MGVTRPLIGLTGRRWPARYVADRLPPSFHDAEIDVHFTECGAAVAAAGGLPVLLTWDAPVAEMVNRLDGVVLTGGADIDPSSYGAQRSSGLGPTEAARDAFELAVLDAAVPQGRPVLGICRGLHLLNVAFGGTLRQHVELGDGDGHPRFEDPRHERCHAVAFEPGSLARSIYGDTRAVNSLHHQVIERTGTALRVSGRSPDGTVEAVEDPERHLLGVQWHPEALVPADPAFAWLVAAARQST